MKLWSDSWVNGERIGLRFAAGRPDGQGGATFSDNLNPHLAWSDAPAGTKSFALICHDVDVPSRADDVNQAGREVLIKMRGFSVTEIPVKNNPRLKGQSHYGIRNRAFKTFMDLLGVWWLKNRSLRYDIAESIN